MASILLVADDLALIASVKRVLAREGYECVLATNAADAIIAFSHGLPGLVLLQPSVESERGQVVLEELQLHPDAGLLRVVLLGESVPGHPWPVEPLPIEPAALAQAITDNFRAAERSDDWSVVEPSALPPPPEAAAAPPGPDAWRATAPTLSRDDGDETEELPESLTTPGSALDDEVPPLTDVAADFGFVPAAALEAQMHADVEAQALASLAPLDDELERLEAEVRAEAQRRRDAAGDVAPAAPPPADASPGDFDDAGDETTSDEGDHADALTVSQALLRAEQRILESRAAAEVSQRSAEADLRRQRETLSMAEAARERVAELESSLAEAHRRLEAAEVMEARVHDLSWALDDLSTQQTQLRAVLAEQTQRSDDAERAAAQTQAELSLAQQALADADAREVSSTAAGEQLSARLTEATERAGALDAEVAHLTQLLEEASAARNEATARLEETTDRAGALEAEVAGLTQALADAQALNEATETRLRESEQRATSLDDDLATLTRAFDEARQQALATQASLEEAVEARDDARERVAAESEARRDDARRAKEEAEALTARLEALQASLDETTGELERTRERLSEETQAAAEARDAMAANAEAAQAEARRAEAAEAVAAKAHETIVTLERQALASLALPSGVVEVPRSGEVALDGLAQLVARLAQAQANGRLELGVPGGTRTLWLTRGEVSAVESTLPHESLIDRARRDGLIDARQEAELRMLKPAPTREQLKALEARGAIRDDEAAPLVQRFTEQTTLEALSEPSTHYRFSDEAPTTALATAAAPRATLPMLAEALRRAVPADALLEQLGGGDAVPSPVHDGFDLRALGFSERERKMLSWADDEASVEDLTLASGLRPEVAWRALLVARLLGALTLTRPETPAPRVDPDLEVRRLEAKYDEVQDADYFTILGLPRSAGADDVQRAFHRLGDEFDPLRFSGHPDAGLQQRAQAVYRLLEEAARALEDDRRRAEYARHLLD